MAHATHGTVFAVSDAAPLRLMEVHSSDLGAHAGALSEIFAGRLTGIVIRHAFQPEALKSVVEHLECADFGLQPQPATHFKGQTYGRVLIVGDRELGDYFREGARFRAACRALFADGSGFEARIEELLRKVGGGRSVSVPRGPDGASYTPATIRGLHAGGQIDLHCENETVEFPSMWHLSGLLHARNQLSYYVMLALPQSGGELVIHNARHGEGAGQQLDRIERAGSAAIAALAPYGELIPYTAVGDMIVFDSGRHFHRVTEVVGPRTRWTMGGFLARSLDDSALYYWS
jgi:hypothetical protein